MDNIKITKTAGEKFKKNVTVDQFVLEKEGYMLYGTVSDIVKDEKLSFGKVSFSYNYGTCTLKAIDENGETVTDSEYISGLLSKIICDYKFNRFSRQLWFGYSVHDNEIEPIQKEMDIEVEGLGILHFKKKNGRCSLDETFTNLLGEDARLAHLFEVGKFLYYLYARGMDPQPESYGQYHDCDVRDDFITRERALSDMKISARYEDKHIKGTVLREGKDVPFDYDILSDIVKYDGDIDYKFECDLISHLTFDKDAYVDLDSLKVDEFNNKDHKAIIDGIRFEARTYKREKALCFYPMKFGLAYAPVPIQAAIDRAVDEWRGGRPVKPLDNSKQSALYLSNHIFISKEDVKIVKGNEFAEFSGYIESDEKIYFKGICEFNGTAKFDDIDGVPTEKFPYERIAGTVKKIIDRELNSFPVLDIKKTEEDRYIIHGVCGFKWREEFSAEYNENKKKLTFQDDTNKYVVEREDRIESLVKIMMGR